LISWLDVVIGNGLAYCYNCTGHKSATTVAATEAAIAATAAVDSTAANATAAVRSAAVIAECSLAR